MRGKNVIYRNLLESISDIPPRILLVTLMLHVSWNSEEVHFRSEMNCDEMVEMLYYVYCFHTTPQKHSKIIYIISFFYLNRKNIVELFLYLHTVYICQVIFN